MHGPQQPDFSSFVDVARLLNSSLELNSVLRRLLDGLDRLLGPSEWSLLLRDNDDLVFTLVRGETEQMLVGQRLCRGEGIAGWVVQQGETLLIPDVAVDPRFSPRMDEKMRFSTKSILAVPLRTGDQVIGVIEVINALDEREFTAEDLQILEAFANFAAVAIENARRHEALLEANRNDPLTGLRNSTYFLTSVDAAVGRKERFALLFFDMDRFKPLVDQYGHLRGSAALAEVGRLLATSLQPAEEGCRVGGDEFALLLGGADAVQAAARAGALAEGIRAHTFLSGDGIHARLDASFGWAAFPEDAGSASELLQLADARMYAAKRSRRAARDQ
jgi:diguanylate cyclase (GGDEF)-like protein